jgi:hypothetical protein
MAMGVGNWCAIDTHWLDDTAFDIAEFWVPIDYVLGYQLSSLTGYIGYLSHFSLYLKLDTTKNTSYS